MDIAQRIAQFENMCRADPENEMAHFSLGSAYAQAGRHADAAASFLRCTELAPGMSKAYQVAAESLIKAGQRDRAAEVLLRGYAVAMERGDRMPMAAMAEMLGRLGRPVPAAGDAPGRVVGESAGGAAAVPPSPTGAFICQRTGRPGTRMSRPPFKGPVGEWIAANISKETWNTWIGQGTKVINELRLDLSRPEDSDIYDQHMREFLGIDEALYEQLTGAR
jgi:Fe-S cluster biosynthesis and repair protein YggX